MHQVPFTGYLRVFQFHSFTFSSCCSWTCCCDSLKEKLLSSLACALPAAIVHAQIPCASCWLNVHSPWNPLVTVVGPLSLSLPYRAYLLCYLSFSLSLCTYLSISVFVFVRSSLFRLAFACLFSLAPPFVKSAFACNVFDVVDRKCVAPQPLRPSPLLPYRAYARLHLFHSPLAIWRPLVFAFWASVSVHFTHLLFLYFCFVSLRSIPFRFIHLTFVFTFLCAFILPFCVRVCVRVWVSSHQQFLHSSLPTFYGKQPKVACLF